MPLVSASAGAGVASRIHGLIKPEAFCNTDTLQVYLFNRTLV
jgi:hypothetical protein